MFCGICGKEYSENEDVCRKCGCVLGKSSIGKGKERFVFIILALIFGGAGFHNFYAGYYGRGFTQLILTVASFGSLLPVTAIWSLLEVFIVKSDASGTLMN